jgi:predicted DNA-binding transcriptional regulator AlpA
MTRSDATWIPGWLRYLSREEAARYLGVSETTFDEEVRDGLWPPPRRRGRKAGRATWDRLALDAQADRDSGLAAPAVGVSGDAAPTSPAMTCGPKA